MFICVYAILLSGTTLLTYRHWWSTWGASCHNFWLGQIPLSTSSPFPPLYLSLPSPTVLPPLRSRPLKYSWGAGQRCKLPQRGCGGAPVNSSSNFGHFSLEMWQLVANEFYYATPTPAHPSVFLSKLGRITRPIFSKSGEVHTSPCGSASAGHRHMGQFFF